MNKICSKCKQEKELPFFTKDKRRKSGYGSLCKKCSYEISKESKSWNREHYRIYIRNYMRIYRKKLIPNS
jgi:superfamily II helicase